MKRNFSKSLLVGASLLCLSTEVIALPLNEDLAHAYNNNPTLKAEIENLKSTNESLPQAYSGWLPNVSASYSIGKEKEKLNDSTGRSQPNSRNLTISQPIFNGGQTVASIKKAREGVKAGQARLHDAEQRVLLSAIQAYINVVHAREVVSLSKHNEKVLGEQLESTETRFQLGETTRTDVAQSKSRLAVGTSDRIRAEGNLIASEAEYESIFLKKPDSDMSIPENLPEIPSKFRESLDLALDNNPSLIFAQHNRNISESNIDISISKLLPSVTLNGEVARSGNGGLSSAERLENETISLNVRVPLYQSGAEYSSVRQAKYQSENSRYNYEIQKNKVTNILTNAWKDVTTSRANIKATFASAEAAKIALEGVKQEQEIGSRTTLDVLDAEQEQFIANVNYITARKDEVVAVYSLLSAIGELTAKDLNLNTKYYNPKKDYNNTKFKFFGIN